MLSDVVDILTWDLMTNEDCRSPSQTLHVLSSLHQSADLDLVSEILGVFLAIKIALLQYAPAASYHPPDCALQADILIVPQPLSFSEASFFLNEFGESQT